MIHLTVDEVRATAFSIVREVGENFIYLPRRRPGVDGDYCMYVHNGEPDCLVGRILARLGVSVGELQSRENNTATQLLDGLDADGVLTYEPGVATYLGALQGAQDSRRPWSECLAKADKALRD